MDNKMNVDVVTLVKKMELSLRLLIENRISSKYRSVFKGEGLEFENYREYAPGDDASRIDWRASARGAKTLVKEFREERDLSIYFLLDVSSSMIFGSGEKLKNEYAAELVASLSHFILQMGDNVGLYMFNDEVRYLVSASSSSNQYYSILKSLVDSSHYGGGYNLKNSIEYVLKTTKRKGMLFIISDFIGLKPGWDDAIKIATGKFDVVGVMIRDRRDLELPGGTGQVVISDPFTGKTMLVDPDEIKQDYEKFSKTFEEAIHKKFSGVNADFFQLVTDEPFVKPIINFFRRRELLLRR